jgi:LDH2 family malate/lactate/ureidoglycolate dehydrogenase
MAQAQGARIAAAAIASLIEDAMQAVGLPNADAAKVAELMVEADLTGADAHGVFRLPQYIRRIKAGGVNPKARITVEKTAPATAMVDGDNGMGHLVMQRAANTAIALARESGVAWVGARRSNHAGASGVYAAMTLPHDMVGIYAVVANANHMPVWDGAENLLGTNPIAVSIPAGQEPPVVLVIATTVVSYGTVKAQADAGRLDDRRQGRQAAHRFREKRRGPADADRRPQGLRSGAGAGPPGRHAERRRVRRDVVDFNADDSSACDTGHFIIALDVSRFLPVTVFKAQIDRRLQELRSSKVLPGFDAIRLPGEQRQSRRAERAARGVPVFPEVVGQLDTLANELKIKPLRERT